MDNEKLRQQIGVAAKAVGKTVEEHMLDTIADLKTSAGDSIIRVGVLAFIIGVVVGAIAF